MAAPEKMRMKVKLAASMLVCFSANRQSRELLANAIIASSVRMKSRVGFTTSELRIKNYKLRRKKIMAEEALSHFPLTQNRCTLGL